MADIDDWTPCECGHPFQEHEQIDDLDSPCLACGCDHFEES